jgi:hypothetical protein
MLKEGVLLRKTDRLNVASLSVFTDHRACSVTTENRLVERSNTHRMGYSSKRKALFMWKADRLNTSPLAPCKEMLHR